MEWTAAPSSSICDCTCARPSPYLLVLPDITLCESQISDPEKLDAIFVPVGGGGLIAGIAAYTKALKPDIKVGPC